MTEVGVRELRDHLSRWLDRVQAGEEVVVTDRGRAIARIGPSGQTRMEELIDQGVIIPPTEAKTDSLPPLVGFDGSVAELVAEQRR